MDEKLLEELIELLKIPSISSGGGDPNDITRAAEWLVARIKRAGGTAGIVETPGNPLVVGDLAGPPDSPTILIYGHYDVQSADPVEDWASPPFEPTIRDGRLYARGASDDKGNFYPVLFVACEMAAAGELPLNVHIVVEGEEEVGSDNIINHLRNDTTELAAAIVFDGGMVDADTPALTLAARGMIMMELDVTVGVRNLHSGLYGGSVLNAIHVMNNILAKVMPGPDGRLRDELREDIVPPTEAELEAWKDLPPGIDVITGMGGRPVWSGSGTDYYLQNWADASMDVSGVAGGDAFQIRTIIPSEAHAKFSMRLAPGQSEAVMKEHLERILLEDIPEGADVRFNFHSSNDPALFDADSDAIRIALDAFERAVGTRPALTRIGGSLPLLVALSERKIPTIISGFALAEDALHSPNESFRLVALEQGAATARELFIGLSKL